MYNTVLLIVWGILGLGGCVFGAVAARRNLSRSRALVLAEIKEAENDLLEDIESIGEAQLELTQAGKDLLVLRGMHGEYRVVSSLSSFAHDGQSHSREDALPQEHQVSGQHVQAKIDYVTVTYASEGPDWPHEPLATMIRGEVARTESLTGHVQHLSERVQALEKTLATLTSGSESRERTETRTATLKVAEIAQTNEVEKSGAKERFAQWLRRIFATAETEIECERCQALLPAYVEIEVTGRDPAARLSQIKAHLAQCPDCAEEHQGLRAIVALESKGGLPEAEEGLAKFDAEPNPEPAGVVKGGATRPK